MSLADLGLAPPLRYPGGQSRTANRLIKYFPRHDTYVEPFVGGGSFFFAKEPAETEVIGDTSPWLIDFYDQVRRGALRSCYPGGIPNRDSVLQKHLGKPDACSRLVVSALAFGGGLLHKDKRSTQLDNTRAEGDLVYRNKMKPKKLAEYERRLRAAYLTTGSFERTMRKYDSSTTWHLLDPPWPDDRGGIKGRSDGYYGKKQSVVTPAEVAKVSRKMKGIVWVIYNDAESVRKAFCGRGTGFKCYRVKMPIFHPTKGAQVGYKIIASNRRIK